MKFQGYYQGWNRCVECGGTLNKVGETLRHKPNAKRLHDLVVAKRLEFVLIGERKLYINMEGG